MSQTRASRLRIGIAQLPNSIDLALNESRIIHALDELAKMGAEFALFPECMLTGFSAKVAEQDFSHLAPAMDRIRERCESLGLAAWVPSAWRMAGEPLYDEKSDQERPARILNAGLIFRPGQVPRLFAKEGLTESERGFFQSLPNPSRVIEWRGLRLGLLICREAAEPAWTYFSQDSLPDAILWPGYWSWGDAVEWGPSLDGSGRAVFENQKSWQRPILQSNFSHNDFGGRGPTGLSVVIDRENRLARTGKFSEEDHYVVEVESHHER